MSNINNLEKRMNYKEIELKWQTKGINEKTYKSIPDERKNFQWLCLHLMLQECYIWVATLEY